MTRETSIAVYRELEASGALSRLRLVVAKDIAENGPTTQAETWSRLSAGKSQRYKDSYSPRFVDLQAMGVIETVGERPCAVSKKTCLAWDLTGKMPIRPETRQTRVELEREACNERVG